MTERPAGYFEHERHDVLDLIPLDARFVVDVGCGSGALGAALKARQECRVIGVEGDSSAWQIASERLDDCELADVEDWRGGAWPRIADADCLVFADVLEHLRDPETVLRNLVSSVSDGASVIISVPNAASVTLLASLAQGRFQYQPAGVMDETHLRWFGLEDLLAMVKAAGLQVAEVRAVRNALWSRWNERQESEVNIGDRLTVHVSGPNDPLFVEQWLVRAAKRPQAETDRPEVTIVVPVWNCVEETRNCVESLCIVPTEARWECVIVDNGSRDETAGYLEELKATDCRFRVITNEENLGFARAVNQGIRASDAEFVCILNNDTVVTPGWLDRLVATARMEDSIGLVGPVSNFVSGPQLVPTSYSGVDAMMAYAGGRARTHAGKFVETDRLVGFCLLLTRAVIESVGLLDEQFGLGTWEDDDLCRRARDAGFRCMVCEAAFVHHKGHATMLANGLDPKALAVENEALYRAKHSAPDGTRPTVALTMIVRNEEANLPRLLASVDGLFDEIVIVDTGSTDRTREIAEAAGARVVEWAWRDDFAAARNVAIDHAGAEWCLWLDADDELLPDERVKLERLLANLPASYAGFGIRCRCHEPDAVYFVDNIRLFRRRDDVRFEGCVHEQIHPAIIRAGGIVAWSDVIIDHHGYADAGALEGKLRRNEAILKSQITECPEDPELNWWLGRTLLGLHDWGNAAACLGRAIRFSDGNIHPMAYAALASVEARFGMHPSALRTALEGLRVSPGNRALLYTAGQLAQATGELARGRQWLEAALRADQPTQLVGETTVGDAEILFQLAVGAKLAGDHADADEWADKALAARPELAEQWAAFRERVEEAAA